jgi:hypothetical protein
VCRIACSVLTLLDTGCRISEALSLRGGATFVASRSARRPAVLRGMENTPYMENVAAAESVRRFAEDPEAQLEGSQIMSMEALDADEAGVFTYLTENFASFLRHVRLLAPRDQELLLAYYCLEKRQEDIAPLFGTTQTMASWGLRQAVRAAAAVMLWGGQAPTADQMEPILRAASLDRAPLRQGGTVALAEVAEEYQRCRSFAETARRFGMWRPDVRRTMSKAAEALRREGSPPDQQALGAWIARLIEKAHPSRRGLTEKERAKTVDIWVSLGDELGEDRVRVQDAGRLFVSKANI